MTLGLYEERARRRRSRRWAVLRWILVIGLIGAIAVFAYESGRSLAEAESAALRDDVAELEGGLGESQRAIAQLEARLALAERARQEAERRFQAELPTGSAVEFLPLIQEKLDSGITKQRLTTALGELVIERDCDAEGVTKRFIVTTALSGNANNSVRFVEGTLVITAEGDSALNAQGKPEAWFDTAKPITVRFQVERGEATEVTGVLPLSRSVILGDREHLFEVASGNRGFVEVTGLSCVYP